MTFNKEQRIDLMKELVSSHEWEVLREHLERRRNASMDALKTTTSMDVVFRTQARVQEDEYLLNLPHQIIKEVNDG